MNIDFKKFNILTRTKKQAKVSSEADFLDPVREWSIGLFIATALFLIGSAYIAFDFYKQFVVSSDGIQIETEVVTYSERDVRKYAEIYIERQKLFEAMRQNRVYTPPTPSEEDTETEVDEEVEELAEGDGEQ